MISCNDIKDPLTLHLAPENIIIIVIIIIYRLKHFGF